MEPKVRERISVLVVDDHRAVAEAIGGAMSSERGLAVSVAWSGEEALEVVRRDPPDVILMDVAMPGMGGLEATRRILEANPDLKVIMLSAHDDDLLKARALETGAVRLPVEDQPDGPAGRRRPEGAPRRAAARPGGDRPAATPPPPPALGRGLRAGARGPSLDRAKRRSSS